MIKKLMTVVVAMTLFAVAQAHDEGHGPKLSDTGKFGGLVSGVVLKSEAKLGAKAALVHKAELVRSADGAVRIYLYGTTMSPLDLKTMSVKAVASLAAKVKGKWKSASFDLELKDGSFIGNMPKPEAKPYNIDVVFKDGEKELLTAFDNLD